MIRPTRPDKPMNNEKPSYLDENLTEREKKTGQTRLPQPNEESAITEREEPYPGREDRSNQDFERPDEFGDGDRRS
jgi:hypothetical protein